MTAAYFHTMIGCGVALHLLGGSSGPDYLSWLKNILEKLPTSL